MTFIAPSAAPSLATSVAAEMGRRSDVNFSVASAHLEVAAQRYETLEVSLDPRESTYWAYMSPRGRPSFSMELLRDILAMQASLQHLFARHANAPKLPAHYYVMASKVQGVFNLGGDLGHFAERIRSGDRGSLLHYGETCVEAVYGNAVAFGLPLVTIALVQGDALGGGFECALAFDVIVAERRAKFGLPEILFNLFPGMGAYSFLSRRVGPVKAEQMITSGQIYSAEELHSIGIVDVLAEDGEGEMAVRDYIAKNERKRNAYLAMYRARRRVNPVTLSELRDIVGVWVDAAMELGEPDLRKMCRLAAAQDRRMAAMEGRSQAA
ncbi:crotonase/enoyl-CoA hydratase family protein [Roseomonas populi]|uniref:Crotonase/enoyl-CoA hydratase family protein n=1 Tax=Roseomonas populi TaxID=3121582 RepID=A0ABT1XEB6_9PROT|nr:crotonase/enoyl-CoA hydratase family protein [Roseomonas pecuniae]MCR0985324.1 crotonase/enoyl-CoA hydratase family protein [Roseomonas pecuniae]